MASCQQLVCVHICSGDTVTFLLEEGSCCTWVFPFFGSKSNWTTRKRKIKERFKGSQIIFLLLFIFKQFAYLLYRKLFVIRLCRNCLFTLEMLLWNASQTNLLPGIVENGWSLCQAFIALGSQLWKFIFLVIKAPVQLSVFKS